MKRLFSLMLALVLLLSTILAAGCASPSTSPTSGPATSPPSGTTNGSANGSSGASNGTTGPTAAKKAADLMLAVRAAERPANPGLPATGVRQGFNRFAAALLKASAGSKGNVMVSPASVYLALAMALNGADGETRAAMVKVLAGQGITVEQINQASRDWTSLLSKTGEKTSVSIANSIWFDQTFAPYKPFLQANADYYGASARKLDFRDPATVGIINDWVKEATRGKIDKIVDQIRPDVMMYFINAIHFKSDWLNPFDKGSTRKRTFRAPDGDLETDFMHRIGKMGWFAGLGATGITLPYENGQFAYFAMLPDGTATPREWLAKQDETALFESIAGLMAQKSDFSVDLAMPKFESRYEDSLVEELSRMGLEIAFTADRADFSQMNESRRKELYIGDVRHKTFVRVDEKGTEAAAVTSIEMRVTSMPQVDKQLTLDKPFLYGIMDLKTGMPLFVGIMEKPAV